MVSRLAKIAFLNDKFRTSWDEAQQGHIVKTHSIQDMPPADQLAIFSLIQNFNAFVDSNDPYGEHQVGSVEYNGHQICWKIDYYDKSLTRQSEDAADPGKTTRVMTIVFDHEG